jgi:hypothetical protein
MSCFKNSLSNVAASKAGVKLFKEGKLSGAQAVYHQEKPEEELYDLEKILLNSKFWHKIPPKKNCLPNFGKNLKAGSSGLETTVSSKIQKHWRKWIACSKKLNAQERKNEI